jgi:hypothetical protein
MSDWFEVGSIGLLVIGLYLVDIRHWGLGPGAWANTETISHALTARTQTTDRIFGLTVPGDTGNCFAAINHGSACLER